MRFYLILFISINILICNLNGKETPNSSESTSSNISTKEDASANDDNDTEDEDLVSTQHSFTIQGTTINYTATVGHYYVQDDAGKDLGAIFCTTYTKKELDKSRPIIFAFNGGPGASSTWLHLGLLGPKRIEIPQNFQPLSIPTKLINNEFSLLDKADLVFVDPVNTGLSYAAEGTEPSDFFNIKGDIDILSRFIKLFLSKNNRWNSPKFLVGESYGGLRVVEIANNLMKTSHVNFNGLILVSPVLRYDTIDFSSDVILPYIISLPTYTATAFHFKKLNPNTFKNFDDAIQKAENFALNEYLPALYKGDSLSNKEREVIAEKFSTLTGLDKKHILDSNLKIPFYDFSKCLFKEDQVITGFMDGRYTSPDTYPVYPYNFFDNSLSFITPGLTAAINDYLRSDLGYISDKQYITLNPAIISKWQFPEIENQYYDVSSETKFLIRQHPFTKIHFCLGYYDFATPFYGSIFTLHQLNIPNDLKKNISISYYHAGHMMYFDLPSLEKQKTILSEFIDSTLSSSVTTVAPVSSKVNK